MQVGFVMKLVGKPLTADLEDFLPDYKFAFEGSGPEAEGFYYTTSQTACLDERFGDMLHKIRDLEVGVVPSEDLAEPADSVYLSPAKAALLFFRIASVASSFGGLHSRNPPCRGQWLLQQSQTAS